ncbi:MAG: rhomboid family protein, partial [Phycisphaerales bacterium]|nr:rhomboid family protein [Phycisphaerales bacterium]
PIVSCSAPARFVPLAMGIDDRDYNRAPVGGRAFGGFQGWSVTIWLIVINVAVFLLELMDPRVGNFGYFSAFAAIDHLQVWRFITFQFLHQSPNHLIFNMIALYFFGPMVESYLGSRRYLAFYLLCGMAGAAMYLLLLMLHLLIGNPDTPLVGASAGIFGILIAAATRVAPDARVMLLFPPIPMQLRTLAWVMVGIAVATVFFNGRNAGGEAAHLGGAVLGYLLIQRPQVLNVFAMGPQNRGPRR